MITNKQVKKALDDCLRTRWEPAAASENGLIPANAPFCQLCEIFCFGKVALGCSACPLGVGGDGCMKLGSTYYKWWSRPDYQRKREAVAMRDKLIEVREHFFGDWK